MPPVLKIVRYIPVRGTIHCLTGLRIGGTKDDIEIGGMDNPVIRDARTRFPYVPGSSLKGKMRSSLEYRDGKVASNGDPHGCRERDCLICTLFGPHKITGHDHGPTRVLVRDAPLLVNPGEDPDSWIEVKSENMIDRRTGIAQHPRPSERVVPGARFGLDISIRVFQEDTPEQLQNTVLETLRLIEHDYIGASGSRGYGKVRFEIDGQAQA